MRRRIVGSSCAAALLAFAVAAVGQTSSQTPTQSPVQGNSQTAPSAQRSTSSPRTSTAQDVTLVGCIMRGSSSTASAGAGANDFILSNATMAADAAHPSATTGSSTSQSTTSTSRTGSTTTGISGQGAAASYALMGAQADELSKYVGQRVEVVGRMEGGAVGTTGTAPDSAGATASTDTGRTADRHEGSQAATGDTGKDQASTSSAQSGATAGVNSGTTSAGATARDGSASASAAVGTTGKPMPRVNVVSVRPTTGSCL